MSVYIIYIYVHIHTLYTLYIYRRYKHMYIHSVIQAYKSVHAQCRWRDPRAGHAQVCAGRSHTWGCPEPCVQKTQTQSVSRRAWLYKFYIKVKTFQRAIQSRLEGGQRKHMGICPACSNLSRISRALSTSPHHTNAGMKVKVRRWFFVA